MTSLSAEQCKELARRLLAMRTSGQQEIDLVTQISNDFRLKTKQARVLYRDFDRGFHDGTGAMLGNLEEAAIPEDTHYPMLYKYAFDYAFGSARDLVVARREEIQEERYQKKLQYNARIMIAIIIAAIAGGIYLLVF